MPQAKKKSRTDVPEGHQFAHRLGESFFILTALVAVYLVACLVSYDPTDPGPFNSVASQQVGNIGRVLGAWLANFFLFLTGYLAYSLPLVLVCGAFLGLTVLAVGAGVTVTFQLDTDALPCGAEVVNSATISDPQAAEPVIRQAATQILGLQPLLTASFDGSTFPPDGCGTLPLPGAKAAVALSAQGFLETDAPPVCAGWRESGVKAGPRAVQGDFFLSRAALRVYILPNILPNAAHTDRALDA